MSPRRVLGALLVSVLPLTAGCTGSPDPGRKPPRPAPAMRLVAFDSCDDLTTQLRGAARDAVGPYGFDGGQGAIADGIAEAAPAGARNAYQQNAGAGSYSRTNNHEADADEPDLVKTDGRRIVTVDDRGVLRVVDAATRTQTGRLDLKLDGPAQLLLAGDTALVLASTPHGLRPAAPFPRGGRPAPEALDGPRLLTVDLTGAPRLVSSYRGEGSLVAARLTGSTARVVLRSTPGITFPALPRGSDDKRVAANRKAIDAAPASAWLPDYEVTTGGRTERGEVGCERVSRPAAYSGSALVTVLTFNLTESRLDAGDPVTVVADGDTVYATGTSLYVANDHRWLRWWTTGRERAADDQRTEIYRFDTAGPGRPTYAAAGSVPGWLINQYALSEWDGHLRIATTTDGKVTQSAIHVLRQRGATLDQVGKVDGLGKTERIYAVRFLGPRGYVVTFRQTDPLYTVDLADPAKPTVTGELKITGYSSHLQPAGPDRLIGIGQEATDEGRVTGTQVSLFDVADPRRPTRLAQHHVADGNSDAEYDPHALLYWPSTNLLVVPLTTVTERKSGLDSAALALRVTGSGMTQVGQIRHPAAAGEPIPPTIRRSLVIGDELWTVSDAGLRVNALDTLDDLAWLPNR